MINTPKYYLTTKWKKRDGFSFEQPVDYCNDTKLTFEIIGNFENIFPINFSDAVKESSAFNNTLINSQYDSKLWKNDKIKDSAFNKIHDFELSGKQGTGSSVTSLFPFEIFMLNDGFEMMSFCELNAINPGLTIISEKVDNNILYNPKGVLYSRVYTKKDYNIKLCFGIDNRSIFYFKTNKNYSKEFQVDNDINNYEKAINGLLKPIKFVF